ncbi:MAG: sulfatase family protein [Planctomycetota bacterium]|jgi:arylsulfatase A-like enzyme
MGWTGNALADTPNLDRLAAESVRFGNCFTQSPVCSPARHSLNTGQYCHHHGVTGNSRQARPGMTTLAHALGPHAYRCFHQGHMHWAGEDNGYEPKCRHGWVNQAEWFESLPPGVRRRFEAERAGPIRRTTGGPSPRTTEDYSGHFAMTRTVEQIEQAVKRGQKFLAWCAFSEPHPPFYPPSELYAQIDQSNIELPQSSPADAAGPHPHIIEKRGEWMHLTGVEKKQIIAGYLGMVALLDGYVGCVLDALKRLGIWDETTIIWTSDHGDQLFENDLLLKFVMREGSVRVPFMIRVPGIDAGDCRELMEHVDLFPTICELLNVPTPPSVQGRSLVPLLRGERAPADWRDAVFSQIHQINGPDTLMIRTERWKLNVYDGQAAELFDMQADPNEFHNLIAEAAGGAVITELHERIKSWRSES